MFPPSLSLQMGLIQGPWELGAFPDGASGKEPGCQCRRGKRRDQEDPLEEAQQPTPGFLPGESHGHRSLEGYSPCGRKEWDTTEVTMHTCKHGS